jgi:hypothetical protein
MPDTRCPTWPYSLHARRVGPAAIEMVMAILMLMRMLMLLLML